MHSEPPTGLLKHDYSIQKIHNFHSLKENERALMLKEKQIFKGVYSQNDNKNKNKYKNIKLFTEVNVSHSRRADYYKLE